MDARRAPKASRAVLSDCELWACANHYVSVHAANAPIIAAMRADELLAAGDLDGLRTYQSILRRINPLLEPAPQGPLH